MTTTAYGQDFPVNQDQPPLKPPTPPKQLVVLATALGDRKVIYQVIKPFYTPTNPENLVKIGPLHSEIQG